MNNITQKTIFDYMEIEELGDLARLKLCLENINDEELCRKLEEQRNEKIKGVRESMEEKRIRVKDIPEDFADRAINDVKLFFNNKN